MKLKEVIKGLKDVRARGNVDVEIEGVEKDSRNIKKNYLFVAIKGFDSDGHSFIEKAIESGASAIIVQEDCVDLKVVEKIPETIGILVVKNTRYALAICSCNFYGNPSKKFKLIGITGTKGKTTTTYMIKDILEKAGKKVGLIGTIAIYIGKDKVLESSRTTPESNELQYWFNEMVKAKCDVVVMEVSSQSLKLDRVAGSDFDLAVFTNFSEDHISPKEHPDMEDYFNSKLKLFTMCKEGFVNSDDLHACTVPELVPECDIKTYGIDNSCDILAKDITITNSYVDFRVKLNGQNYRIKTDIPGRFSVYNSLAAICVAQKLGVSPENIMQALQEVKVPGRSELVENKAELTVMIDYAHTADSLKNILQAAKAYTRGKVISVFGCGGDRDTGKRPQMGEVSGMIADYTIITSDNPRTEEPEEIIKEIEKGIKKTKGKYEIEVDRTEAIKKAIKMAGKKDIIILAGKGHEPYQEINGVKHPFDERIIVKQIVDELSSNGEIK